MNCMSLLHSAAHTQKGHYPGGNNHSKGCGKSIFSGYPTDLKHNVRSVAVSLGSEAAQEGEDRMQK